MASIIPIMPFLRPLPLPRPSTVRQFLRFSTHARHTSQTQQQRRPRQGTLISQIEMYSQLTGYPDRNLVASQTASQVSRPNNKPSLPRPKISKASRRTAHPPVQRPYPTRQHPYAATTPTAPITLLPESDSAPNLPYFVRRTRGNELPVYTDFKRGGNLKLTIVRKVDGNLTALRDGLRVRLGEEAGLEESRVVVNELTRQVVVKGMVKGVVERFLKERRF